MKSGARLPPAIVTVFGGEGNRVTEKSRAPKLTGLNIYSRFLLQFADKGKCQGVKAPAVRPIARYSLARASIKGLKAVPSEIL